MIIKKHEKLFSTGDDQLDSILEEVYYSGIEDGYDYAQKEFANKTQNFIKRPGILKREKDFSETIEERLFRNKANREATRRWQMEQAAKEKIVITPEGQAKLNEAINTSVGSGVGKQGYQYGQASGPNGTRTLAERQAELLSEARSSNKPTPGINKTTGKWTGKSVTGNSRNTVVYNSGGATNVAIRDAENTLANKGSWAQRVQNLSPERQRELAQRRAARNTTIPTPPPVTPKPTPAPKLQTPLKPINLTQSTMQPKPGIIPNRGSGALGAALGLGALGLGAGAAIYGLSKKKNKDKE